MDRSSRNRLNKRHLHLFPTNNLFDKIARTVCGAECLPRKELYEAWETAKRIHRRIKGNSIIEVGCGHGLLSQILIILDDSIPIATAFDPQIPASAAKLTAVLSANWPRLNDRVKFIRAPLDQVEVRGDELLVSVHGCGDLSDKVIDTAINRRNPVALLPCCHDIKQSDTGGLEGWIEATLAVDIARVSKLQAAGYNVVTQTIPADITPKNRLLIAMPETGSENNRDTDPAKVNRYE